MYAEVPREMLASGNVLYPTLNYAPFLFKPPLFLWANAAALWIFGLTPLAARVPNALFAAGTVLVVYLTGSRVSTRTGIYAGVVMATFYGFVFHTSMMLPDIPLAFFTASSCYFFLKAASGEKGGVTGVYASLALAMMTKGFIGLIFPGLAFCIFILTGKKWDLLRKFLSLKGILVFLAISVPWHLAMEARNPGFLYNYVINEQVLRFFNKRFPPDYDSVDTPLFLLAAVGWMVPWAVFLLQSLARAVKKPEGDTEKLALSWGLAGMVFLCLSSSKMEYYGIPLMPAFAILIGTYWTKLERDVRGIHARLAVSGAALMALLAMAGIAAEGRMEAMLSQYLMLTGAETHAVRTVATWSFISLLAGSAAAALLLVKRRPVHAFAVFAAAAILFSVSSRGALDHIQQKFSDADTASALASLARPDDVVVVEGQEEYEYSSTFCYYAKRKVYILENEGKPVLPVKFPEGVRFIISDDEFRHLWNSGRRVFYATDDDPGKEAIASLPPERFSRVFAGSKVLYVNKIDGPPDGLKLSSLERRVGGKEGL